MAAYSEQLTGAENGWKAFLYTNGEEAYSFMFQFNTSDRVTMYADLSEESSTVIAESSYRLKAVQKPSILFDTYSYLHLLADPDPDVLDGDAGYGRYSDFEFSIDSVSTDTIKLTGNNLGSKLIMVRATKAEADAYKAGALMQMIINAVSYADETPFSFLQVGNIKYETIISPDSKALALIYSENNEDKVVRSAFSFTPYGLHLAIPLVLGGVSFDELIWDTGSKSYYALSGSTKIPVQASTTPSAPLSALLGLVYSNLVVPQGTGTNPLPGTSPLFVTEYNKTRTAILTGPYRLTMKDMTFIFNSASKAMRISLVIAQGTANFVATFDYSYTKSSAGIFQFTRLSSNGNASLIEVQMASILKYIETDGFKVEYFNSGSALLGQLTSQQRPLFFFTGNLR